jgi:diguanylate cyclase (GGDEF)-like protein/PAS domain S-box-containing protein
LTVKKEQKNKTIGSTVIDNETISKAINAVISCKDFTATARKIFDLCRDMVGVKSGYVALLSKDGTKNEVLFLEAGGLECLVDEDLPMPIRGLRSDAYRTGKPVYKNNFMNSKWIKYMPEGHVILKNVLFSPLIIDGDPVGLLGLANKDSDFNDRDAEIAKVFSSYAAIALKSSYMFERLDSANKELESIFDTVGDALVIINQDYDIIKVNKYYLALNGASEADIIGKKCYEIFNIDLCHTPRCTLRSILNGAERFEKEVESINQKGQRIPCLIVATPLRDKKGETVGVIESIKDITDIKRYEENIKKMAYYDYLTDLPNRLLLEEKAETILKLAKRNKKQFAAMIMDLDLFKDVNDTYGHAVGDKLLKSVAHRIKKLLRESDIISRIGGDEFVILLHEISKEDDAITTASKIRDSLKKPFIIDGNKINASVSIGISIFPTHGTELKSLLKSADSAMYDVKERNRNDYCLYSNNN